MFSHKTIKILEKSKYVSVVELIVIMSLILTACQNRQESTEKVEQDTIMRGQQTEMQQTQKQQVTEESDMLNVCSGIYEEVYKENTANDFTDANSKIQQIIERLGVKGYVAVDAQNLVDMTCADKLSNFIRKEEAGENAEISVICVSYNGGFSLYDFTSDNGEILIQQSYYQYKEGKLNKTIEAEFVPTLFEYTQEGYLVFEGYYHSAQQYVLTLSEDEVHVALRIDSLDEKCRQMCNKYIRPISYGLNNIFITEWNDTDYGELDFYDVFEKFYSECYMTAMPYTCSEDLSTGSEYMILADEFESVIAKHFTVSTQELRSRLNYDTDTGKYRFRPRGFGEHDYEVTPYPEVVSYRENQDGSLTLLVNAVYANENTSKLFSHEVTVKDKDGCIYYLSNHIVDKSELKEDDLWWHADRYTDDEWNENYSL